MLQFFATMAATVIFYLTVAITIGVVVAMIIFVLRSSELTVDVSDVDAERLINSGVNGKHHIHTKIIYLAGPLFFGTQDKLTEVLQQLEDAEAIIFSMRGVPTIDDSAIEELRMLYNEYDKKGVKFLFCGVQPRVKGTMDRAGFVNEISEEHFCWDAVSALKRIEEENRA